MQPVILGIDPSINHVGLVVCGAKRGDFLESKHIQPSKECVNSATKVTSICFQLKKYLEESSFELSEIVIEHTRFFARNNNSSHAAAQKLNLVKGALYGVCLHYCESVHLVWVPGFSKENANFLSTSFRVPKVTQHERDAFWLANTWCTANTIIKKGWLESKEH